jgi:hypothetical protein
MTSEGVTCFLHTVGDPSERWYQKPFSPFRSFLAGRTRYSQTNRGLWRDTPDGEEYWQAYLEETKDKLSVANFSGGKFTHLSQSHRRSTRASGTNDTGVRQSGKQIVPSFGGNTRQSLHSVRPVDDDRIIAATTATSASVPYEAIAKRRAAMAAAASTAAKQTTTQHTRDSRNLHESMILASADADASPQNVLKSTSTRPNAEYSIVVRCGQGLARSLASLARPAASSNSNNRLAPDLTGRSPRACLYFAGTYLAVLPVSRIAETDGCGCQVSKCILRVRSQVSSASISRLDSVLLADGRNVNLLGAFLTLSNTLLRDHTTCSSAL